MTRTGKIARLPQAIRDELNRRLADGEPGSVLLPWLNSFPAARAVLESQFGGAAITKQNLSEWRKGGFLEWQARQELWAMARQFPTQAKELREASGGHLTDDLATVLAAQYAFVLRGWNGRVDETLKARLMVLHQLCQDISVLRDGDHHVAQLKFEWERLAFAKEKFGGKALPPLPASPPHSSLRDFPGASGSVAEKREPAMKKTFEPMNDPLPGEGLAAPAANETTSVETAPDGVQPSPTWSKENFFCGAESAGLPQRIGGGKPGIRSLRDSGRQKYLVSLPSPRLRVSAVKCGPSAPGNRGTTRCGRKLADRSAPSRRVSACRGYHRGSAAICALDLMPP